MVVIVLSWVMVEPDGWSSFSTAFCCPLISVYFPDPSLSTAWCCPRSSFFPLSGKWCLFIYEHKEVGLISNSSVVFWLPKIAQPSFVCDAIYSRSVQCIVYTPRRWLETLRRLPCWRHGHPQNFLQRGSNQEVWGSGAQGRSPGGVWGLRPQKLTV